MFEILLATLLPRSIIDIYNISSRLSKLFKMESSARNYFSPVKILSFIVLCDFFRRISYRIVENLFEPIAIP